MGDGRKEGGAAWGMGERNITVCCWSQGVTMVMGERDGRERERERGTRGGGAWENENKKSAVLGSDDL